MQYETKTHKIRELRIVFFAFESNLKSNELQGAPCRRTVWAYMLTTSVVNVCVVLMCYCVCTM